MRTQELSQLSEAAFRALHQQLQRFDSGSRKRGVGYWRDGAVGEIEFLTAMVRAGVAGSRLYNVSWRYSRGSWRPECDCPVGPECKHSYALALELLDMAQHQRAIAPGELARLFGAPIESVPTGLTFFATRKRTVSPARSVAQPTAPRPRSALIELRTAEHPHIRYQMLMAMLPHDALHAVAMDFQQLHQALALDDADERCWELARLLTHHGVPGIPPAIAAYLQRDDIAERVAATRARVLTAQLADWASRRSPSHERSLRLVLSLAPGRRTGMVLQVEPRVTSPRAVDQPRTLEQLRQYRYGLKHAGGALPDDQLELLNGLVRAHEAEQAMRFSPQGSISHVSPLAQLLLSVLPSPHVRWSDELVGSEAARAGIVPGELVRYSPTPANLIPDFSAGADGTIGLGLSVRWPDGSDRPAHDTVLLCSRIEAMREPLFAVIHEGELSPLRCSLPDELVAGLLANPVLPLSRPEATALLPLLANALPAAREAYQSHVKTHAVRTIVALDLDENDRLDFRLFALTHGLEWPAKPPLPPGEHVFELGLNDQWFELPASAAESAPAGADAEGRSLLHLPDANCVRAGVEWLAGTGVRPNAVPPHGTRRAITLSARSIPRLAEAWASRPAGVEWVGTRAVQALLRPGAVFRARVSAKRHGVDLLHVSAAWESELDSLSDEDIARLRTAQTPWVKLSGGWVRRELSEELDATLDTLADLGVEPGTGEQPLSVWQLAQARPESLAALERLGLDAASVQAVRDLRKRVERFKGLPRVAVPRGFTGELRPYQRQGLDFLAWTSSVGSGAVLADDMGLGKTVQALAWLLHLRARAKRTGPALVVCPASVVHNWEREARAFAPGLRVQTLTSGPERAQQLARLAEADLLITNYALLRQDAEAWRAQALFVVIVDEAQMIKNPAAATSKLVCELKAEHRLALTGTPLENRALDLWSIMRFVNPGYLGSERAFVDRFDRADAPAHSRRLLSAKLRPMLLRRLKRDVAPELPERVEERRDCEMSAGQRKLYLAELARARREIEAMAAQGGVKKHKIQILAALTRLRQICCHPALAGGAASVPSGKFEALFELLEPLLAEGHKVLVFSQFVRALELVRAEMKRRRIAHFELTGSTTDRPRVVKAFEQHPDASAFLISLRAGGTGLNLTAANYVVLLDPWWNPAVEAQAIDRTHRIGQDRTVIAYRLLMQGTIEERIWELQQRKAALASDVLGEDGFAKALDREALDYLFAET